jgi:tryptophan halogenase
MKIKNVIIVGGGSAGWLTALNMLTHKPQYRYFLVQPKDNNPIGVGESTQPNFYELLKKSPHINFDEFLKETDATFKCGIYYNDWNKIGDEFWHPFTGMAYENDVTLAHYYQYLIHKDPLNFKHKDYYKNVHSSYSTCVEKNSIDTNSAKALHVDAHKLSIYLQKKLTDITVIEADDIKVAFDDETNTIEGIICDGKEISADLYIDCTGFSRFLISTISDCELKEYHENVDSAFFAKVEYEDPQTECVPYTQATAHPHGWYWKIPLMSRMGVGCVYTQNSITKEECEKQFIDYWDGRINPKDIRHVTFESGVLKSPWVNNCVTAGLSCGFVEPLEATSIAWTLFSSEVLIEVLESDYYDQYTAEMYNGIILKYVDDICDFVDVHYKLSERKDSVMWEYHTTRPHSERLETKLEVYKKYFPNSENRNRKNPWAFNEVSWIDILNGYDFKYDNSAFLPFKNMPPNLLNYLDKELHRTIHYSNDDNYDYINNYDYMKNFYDNNSQ